MAEALVDRYYCHMCSEVVSPVLEAEIKCPFCDSGFVEEMTEETAREGLGADDEDDDIGADRTLSLWAPVLLGMMGNRPRRRRSRLTRMDDESDSDHERELEALLRRRRRSSAILQLLQGLNDDLGLESDAPERERERERERESVILINPFNQAVILQGTFDSENAQGQESNNGSAGASLGDYFIGPGLDMLLQHLADNDPNRYGTPPAKQEAVDAMPTVEVHENLNCSVCLEDFEIGMEAREMPCKHKFHSRCILPWLELHSSCPVCRFQIPADETKVSNAYGAGSREEGGGDGSDRGNASRPPSISWSLRGLFSSSRSRSGGNGNASSNPSSSSTTPESNSHEDEN